MSPRMPSLLVCLALAQLTLVPRQAGTQVSVPNLAIDRAAIESSVEISEEFFSSDSCTLFERCIRGTGLRRLLRFDTVIMNLGEGDLYLGVPGNAPDSLFDYSPCHGHDHVRDFVAYELLDPRTRLPIQVNGAEVVSRKQAFCLRDSLPIKPRDAANPGKFHCEVQGITAGWADIYDRTLDCQWLDITDVPAGLYLLRLSIDPSGLISELDRTDNAIEVPVRIP